MRLIDQARADFGISRGDWVRSVVVSHIHQNDHVALTALLSDIAQSAERLDGELAKVQTNLGRTLFAILTVVGGMEPNDAKDIVRNKLLA